MNLRNTKNRLRALLPAIALAACFTLAACDMMFIPSGDASAAFDAGGGTATPGEIAELEKNGHYLKLANMPYNTRAGHVKSCLIANSDAAVAQTDRAAGVAVFLRGNSADVYINLASNDGSPFTDTGSFYVSLAVYIDALTWINVIPESKVIAGFVDGRGVLDVLTLVPGETISPGWPVTDPGITEQENELQQNGRYLKLVNMPANTLPRNVLSCVIAAAHGNVARLDTKTGVSVFRHTAEHAAVYISLVNTDGSEFTASGPFFVILSVSIDANTWINITREAAVIVDFTDGRGSLDALSLVPGETVSPEWPVTEPDPLVPEEEGGGGGSGGGGSGGGGGLATDEEIAEMERNGRYLMLYHLPAGTIKENISGLAVSDGAANIAIPDTAAAPLLAADGIYINAYLPLRSASGGFFTRSGSFRVAFTVRIDALTAITVNFSHNVIVEFAEGRGILDIESLVRYNPGVVGQTPDPETEEQIDDIVSRGGYIRFYNVPRNASKNSFSAVSVSNDLSVLARPPDYESIAVRKNVLDAEAFVPVNSIRGGAPFSESGDFRAAFTIIVDALTRITVLPSYASLYLFDSGNADVNVALAPGAPEKPPAIPHCLTIGGLPPATGAPAIAEVVVRNSAGVVAKCPDYKRVYTVPYDGKTAAVIPLVYDNSNAFNGSPFSGTGNFIVTFTIFPDAQHVITAIPENNCLVSFSDGNAFFDVSNIPPVPRRTLSITNLPANMQATDVAEVFVWNQTGKIAQCMDYNLIEELSLPGSAAIRIPLVYSSDDTRMFRESGPFYVSFDLNADAFTRYLITDADHIVAGFSDGNAVLDASLLPAALPTPYLTIIGLPPDTAKGNFSEVFLYNAAGKIAACPDYSAIIVSQNGASASAMIPLAYNASPQQYFRDSGEFVVTFVINVDVNTVIRKDRTDAFVTRFSDGSGEVNLSGDYGYSSVTLANPADLAVPVIKAGSIFEMNGGYEKVTANAAAQPAGFPSTRVVYLYAAKSAGTLSFTLSDSAPAWNPDKNGFYSGNRRALFKLLYVKDSVTKYAAKTPIADNWKNFDHYTLDSPGFTTQGRALYYSVNGAANPPPAGWYASPGWYAVEVSGSGGGGSGGIDGKNDYDRPGNNGGPGGYVAEIVYLPGGALTAFAGSGGRGGGYTENGWWHGTGAGGGGAAAFLYDANGYFLCAGGGGGAGGSTASDGGGGGGGSGGAAGPGAGGGAGANSFSPYNPAFSSVVISGGGVGGGYGGGTAGAIYGGPGGNADAFVPANGMTDAAHYGRAYDTGGYGGSGGIVPTVSLDPPLDWRNTNNASGTGGWGGERNYGERETMSPGGNPLIGDPGGPGGNNRNSLRGNGASGGNAGAVANGPASAGQPGGAGFLKLYRVQ